MGTQFSASLRRLTPLIVGFVFGLGVFCSNPTFTFAENTAGVAAQSGGASGIGIQDQTGISAEKIDALTESAVLVDAPFSRGSVRVITVLIASLVALSIVVLAMIFLTVWLYQWRIRFRDNEGRTFRTVVPEKFVDWLNNHSDRIKESINNQAGAAEDIQTLRMNFAGLQESTLVETKKIRDMLEIHRSLLEAKDEEIKRLKSLYEAVVFHRFLRRFVEVDRFITDIIKAGDVRSDDLTKIQHFLRGALEDCHVERFSEEVIGVPFRELGELVEDNPDQEPTNNPDDHGLVSKVLEVGYRLRTLEESTVVRPARVKIFQAIEQPVH